MPDKGRRAETDLEARLLQAPAQVHVVARLVEHRVEPADLLQRPFVERHVAAGNVLGLAVGQHHVRRSARRSHDRRGHQRILRRQEVGAAHAREAALQQTAHQVIQPVLVRPAVGVRERDDLTRRGGDAGVARDGEAEVLLVAKVADIGMREGDLPRRVGRAVVHQDHFVVRVIEPLQRIQAGLERALAVVAGHHHRDSRAARQREIRRRAKHLLHGPKRRLRLPVARGQPHLPVFDLPPAAPPVVGEGEHDRAGQPAAKGAFDLPLQDFSLGGLRPRAASRCRIRPAAGAWIRPASAGARGNS